jgi:hypothetical protein
MSAVGISLKIPHPFILIIPLLGMALHQFKIYAQVQVPELSFIFNHNKIAVVFEPHFL